MPTAVDIEVKGAAVAAEKEADPTAEERALEKEDDAVMGGVYKALTGVADSTEEGYASAIAAYNIFAEKQQWPNFRSVTKTMLSGGSAEMPMSIGNILATFATFLIEYKIEKEGKRQGKHFMPGSQQQYLSGVKTVWKKKFPSLSYWKNGEAEYKDLWQRLSFRGRVAAINRGDSPGDSTIGLHQDLLEDCNDVLIQEDKYADRCVLNSLYFAVGRGGEVATWSWGATSWNPRQEQLESDWRETKTSKNGLMTWHPHANTYLLDMLHSMAAYIATADGKFEVASASTPFGVGASMVFPEFFDLKTGGAAAKVSRILEGLRGKVDGLAEDHTGHSLRVGSADDMVYHRFFNMVASIARGNWDYKGDCSVFTYWTMKLFVAMAGKNLCKWKDPNQDVYCAKLDVIVTASNFQMIENWMAMLFSTVGIPELHKNGSLRDFRPVMLAALLKDHGKMVNTYGYKNRLVRRMIDSAAIFGICHTTLVQWSKAITDDWESRNATNFLNSNYTSHEEKQTILIEQLRNDFAEKNKRDREEAYAKIASLEIKVDRLLDLLENNGASPRKRRAIENGDGGSVALGPVAAAAQGAETEREAASANAINVLMASNKPVDPYSSDLHLRSTTLRKLLETIVYCRINWRSSKSVPVFGTNVGRSLKSKVVILLDAIHDSSDDALISEECYTIEQLPYLDGSNIPADKTGEEYAGWMDYSTRIYTSVEKKFMLYFARKFNRTVAEYKVLMDATAEEDKKKVPKTKSYSAGDYGSEAGKTPLLNAVGSLSSNVEILRGMIKTLNETA